MFATCRYLTWALCFASIVVGATARAQTKNEVALKTANASKPAPPAVLALARTLVEKKTEADWDRLLAEVGSLRSAIEKKLDRVPYDPKKLADSAKLRKLKMLTPGVHNTWYGVRAISKMPPGPGGSYINGALGVLAGHLAGANPRNISATTRTRGEEWDGYISGSILVVDGSILTSSYIYDSIVIAAGPVKLADGYINNSLVISLGVAGESKIDVSRSYSHASLLVAKTSIVGSMRDSISIGRLVSDDLRGAEALEFSLVESILMKSLATSK